MLSISSLIEFLIDLLRDDAAQAEFARDPQAMLARHGLENVSAQDVCDAQPILADVAGVRPHRQHDDDDGGGHHQPHHHSRPQHDDDPVREIHHVVNNHTVDHHVVKHDPTYNTYNNHYSYTDNSITADTVIQDSFNEDNDGVDNKGGIINDSNVANGDQEDVGNSEETTTIEDSFDDETTDVTVIEDVGNDSSDNSTSIDDSGNDSSTSASVEVTDSYNDDNSLTADVDEPVLADATI
jgi:hypothetical protein